MNPLNTLNPLNPLQPPFVYQTQQQLQVKDTQTQLSNQLLHLSFDKEKNFS